MNVVHTVKGRVTHKVAEVQGTNVLTGCGLTLVAYSEMAALYPTCRLCARKC